MNIFQMKTKPHNPNIERAHQFIDEKFVCIGWPNLGNLTGVSKDQIREKLAQNYGYSGHKLGNSLGMVNAFVNTMTKGDTVIISDKDWAYIGTVGEYVYVQKYDNDQDGMCHQRSVEWTDRVLIVNLDNSIQKLLSNRNTICQYPGSYEESGLEKIIANQPKFSKASSEKLDSLIADALLIFEEELKSDDSERRIKAATELLKMKSN